jgi:molecular chaperone DnaK
MAMYNKTLGKFQLVGIPPAPRGMPQIDVTFDIDANGILSVTARDEATAKDQKITITANSGLSDSEISRMVDEGKSHEAEDKKRRDQIETRNRADQLCYQVEKALDDAKDKVPADKAAVARQAILDLRAAIDKQDHDAIASGTQKLEQLMGEIAASAYQAAGGDGGGAGPGAPGDAGPKGGGAAPKGGKQDEVIDAEFEEGN